MYHEEHKYGIVITHKYLQVQNQTAVASVLYDEHKSPLRIGVILTDRIGDALNSIYFLANLRVLYPHAHLTYLTKAFGDPSFAKCVLGQYADSIVLQDRLSEQQFKALKPDVLFDLNPISELTLYHPRDGVYRIGHHERCDLRIPQPERNWKANDHLNLLRALGKPVRLEYPKLNVEWNQWPQAILPTRPYLALCFEATARTWMMSDALMQDLVDYLLSTTGYDLCVLGNNLNRHGFDWHGTSRRVHQLTGALSLVQTLQALSQADYVIAVDTGLMHAASYLGVPVLSVFTCGDPGKNGPQGQKGIALVLRVTMDPPSNTLEKRDWLQTGLERSYLRLDHIVEGLQALRQERETSIAERLLCQEQDESDIVHAGADISLVSGKPVAVSTWPQVQALWRACDATSTDIVSALSTATRGYPTPTPEGKAEMMILWRELRPLFDRYESTLRTLRQHAQAAVAHPSVCCFYDAALSEARSILLRSLSRYGVLDRSADPGENIRRSVTDILTDLDEFMREDVGIQVKDPRGEPAEMAALVILARDNAAHLRACLHSVVRNTSWPLCCMVVDCGIRSSTTGLPPIPCQVVVRRSSPPLIKSFAAAWGLRLAWRYKYIAFMDANAAVVGPQWLEDMIQELQPGVGAVGIHYGGTLNYAEDANLVHLREHVTEDSWWNSLDASSSTMTKAERLAKLSVSGRTCFNELTGIVQLYHGETLRRIGLPNVRHRVLKSSFWDSELSMRVLALGQAIVDSATARQKVMYFGDRGDSGIPTRGDYTCQVEQDADKLRDRNDNILADVLVAS